MIDAKDFYTGVDRSGGKEPFSRTVQSFVSIDVSWKLSHNCLRRGGVEKVGSTVYGRDASDLDTLHWCVKPEHIDLGSQENIFFTDVEIVSVEKFKKKSR